MQTKDAGKIEWPREKLLHYGANKLTKSELLAILLHAGTNGLDVVELAKNLLRKYPKFSLTEVTIPELEKSFGLETNKACEIMACFELGKRMHEDSEIIVDTPVSDSEIILPVDALEEDLLANFGTQNFSEKKS